MRDVDLIAVLAAHPGTPTTVLDTIASTLGDQAYGWPPIRPRRARSSTR